MDRRTIIKAGAIAGAGAWTAPVIIDSLSSPAAALTASCRLYVYRITLSGNACNGFFVLTELNCASPSFSGSSTCSGCSSCTSGTGWTRATSNDISLTSCTYSTPTTNYSLTVSITGQTFVGYLAQNACSSGSGVALSPGSGGTTQTVTGSASNNTDVYLYFLTE